MKLVLVVIALLTVVACSKESAKPSYVCVDGFLHEQMGGVDKKLDVKCGGDGVDGKQILFVRLERRPDFFKGCKL